MQKKISITVLMGLLFFDLNSTLQTKSEDKDLAQEFKILETYVSEMITKTTNSQGKIKLYVYKNCPFCHKVINYLTSIGKLDQIIVIDAGQQANSADLQRLSGGAQCPFLFDEQTGVSMLESSDIIKYFSTRF